MSPSQGVDSPIVEVSLLPRSCIYVCNSNYCRVAWGNFTNFHHCKSRANCLYPLSESNLFQNGDRKTLSLGWWVHSAVWRWGFIELYTWNLYGFVSQCNPNKFNLKIQFISTNFIIPWASYQWCHLKAQVWPWGVMSAQTLSSGPL